MAMSVFGIRITPVTRKRLLTQRALLCGTPEDMYLNFLVGDLAVLVFLSLEGFSRKPAVYIPKYDSVGEYSLVFEDGIFKDEWYWTMCDDGGFVVSDINGGFNFINLNFFTRNLSLYIGENEIVHVESVYRDPIKLKRIHDGCFVSRKMDSGQLI